MEQIDQTPNQVDAKIDDTNLIDEDAIEREGYGESTYKQVQKLRKLGVQYGVDIPKCKFPLAKPTKPRSLILVTMWVCILSIIAVAGLSIWLFVKLHYFTAMGQLFGVLSGSTSPEVVSKTLGFSGIFTATIFVLIMLLALFLIIPVAIIWLLTNRAISLHSLAYAPRQELAVGYKIKGMIKTAIWLAIFMVAILIFGLIKDFLSNKNGVIVFCILLVGFAVFALSAVALMYEHKKDKTWFDTLSADAQADFIAHNQALKKLSRRKRHS